MVGRAQVLLRIRVLPVALFGRRDRGACYRVPAPRPDPSAVSALLGAGRPGLRLEDRRTGTPLQAKAPAVAAARDIRPGGRGARRGKPTRVRERDPGLAAAARTCDARNVLPSEQSAGE